MSELTRHIVTLYDATNTVVTSGSFESEEEAEMFRLEAEATALEIGGRVEPRRESENA